MGEPVRRTRNETKYRLKVYRLLEVSHGKDFHPQDENKFPSSKIING